MSSFLRRSLGYERLSDNPAGNPCPSTPLDSQEIVKAWAGTYDGSRHYTKDYDIHAQELYQSRRGEEVKIRKSMKRSATILESQTYKPQYQLLHPNPENWGSPSISQRLQDLRTYANLRLTYSRTRTPMSLAQMIQERILGPGLYSPPHARERKKLLDVPIYSDNEANTAWKSMHDDCLSYLEQGNNVTEHSNNTKETSPGTICTQKRPILSRIASAARELDIPIRFSESGDHEQDHAANQPLREFIDLI